MIETLIGRRLSSVVFVEDYLQLIFDGSILTCYIWPEVIKADLVVKYGENDYRNQLCELMNQHVENVVVVDEVALDLIFDNAVRIVLSLDPNNPEIVREIATFFGEDDKWSVFE